MIGSRRVRKRAAVTSNISIWAEANKKGGYIIYHGVKGFVVFMSIIVFWVACSKYQYRERNEVVNVQFIIIENQYERE